MVTIDRPNVPSFDAIPPTLPGDSLEIGWDLNYGLPVTDWEVWDNGQLRYRGRQFTVRPIAPPPSALEGPAFSAAVMSMQSGQYQLRALSPGRHELDINLCIVSDRSERLCVKHEAVTWVGGQQDVATPGKPQVDWLPSVITGEPLELRWNLWWGGLGQYWRLLDNDRAIFESRKFAASDRAIQAGSVRIDSPSLNAHSLRVELCNAISCSQSAPTVVNVVAAAAQAPAVTLHASMTAQSEWLIRWRLPHVAGTSPPDRWRLRNPASGQALLEKQGVSQCPAVSSDDQAEVFSGYCGSALLPLSNAPLSATVQVCAGAQCLESAALVLHASTSKGR
ncbi:chitinase N-terminal domain-containing protein [Variovorax humicola]|uniref:Chitinase N-terminal domain-containing protein n=1 Tax=Variovorax humicola TaxID=1769758 RepID=A0ABU8VS82_9BURK